MGISTLNGYGNPVPLPATQGGAAPVAESKPQAQPAQPAPNGQPTAQELQEAVKEVAKVVTPKANNLQFSIDQSTGRTLVKVVDGSTGDVIRQIPSEEMLDIAKNIERMQGLLMRQKA